MEEDLGRLDAANELRIRRSEQQWEFVIPASFSTRPVEARKGGTLPSSAGGVLQGLLDTLNSFFTARGKAKQQQERSTTAAAIDTSTLGTQQEAVHTLLPSDFSPDLNLENVVPATCLEDRSDVGGVIEQEDSYRHDKLAGSQQSVGSGGDALTDAGSSAAGVDRETLSSNGQHSRSGDGQSIESLSGSSKLSALDRKKGLHQRPQRVSAGAK